MKYDKNYQVDTHVAKLEADIEREKKMGILKSTKYYVRYKAGKLAIALLIIPIVFFIGMFLRMLPIWFFWGR